MDQYMGFIIFVVFVAILLFAVLREVFCWYWKINRQVKLAELKSEQDTAIIDELRTIRSILQGMDEPRRPPEN